MSAREGRVAGVLLAAGGARRFGSQKLVHPIDGIPLVRRAAERLVQSDVDRVIVVTGSDADRVTAALDGLDLQLVYVRDWSSGMSASLRGGVESLGPEVAAMVVSLGDQPDVGPEIVDLLVTTWRHSDAPIVAARFRGEFRPPVLFDRSIFPELLALTGDRGARAVLEADLSRVAIVSFDMEAPADIDEPGDLGR